MPQGHQDLLETHKSNNYRFLFIYLNINVRNRSCIVHSEVESTGKTYGNIAVIKAFKYFHLDHHLHIKTYDLIISSVFSKSWHKLPLHRPMAQNQNHNAPASPILTPDLTEALAATSEQGPLPLMGLLLMASLLLGAQNPRRPLGPSGSSNQAMKPRVHCRL